MLDINGWHNRAKEVLDTSGVATCISTQSNNLLQKIIELKPRHMFKHKENRSRLNKAFRIGYLRMKRKYGEDEVQEQATEIWKLTAEEQSRLTEEDTLQVLSTSFVDDLVRLFSEWKDRFTDEEWQWLKHNVFQMAEILTAISADEGDADKFLSDITPVVLRIRKLTPRECFRLMDMDDKYIDIIQNETTISNSNQYKLAGNSIVVSCLYYLFENLIYPPEEPQGDKYGQLSLF